MQLSARSAIRAQFALTAFLLGLWTLRIAEFKQLADLSHSHLGLLLLIAPITLQITMLQMPKITRRIGVRRMLPVGVTIFAFSIILVSTIPSAFVIALCFLGFGFSLAMAEVSLNAVAHKIDRDDRPIMMSAHGFWSIGMAAGMITSGYLAEHSVSFFTQSTLFGILVIILSAMLVKPLPQPRASSMDQKHSIPSLSFLPFCLIPFAALFAEGAMGDWGSVFLNEERQLNPLSIGVITGAYMIGMAMIRLMGDQARKIYSAKALIIVSTFLIMIGLSFFSLSHNTLLIGLGAFIAGVGSGMVYPLTLVMANEGRSEEEASGIIASVASISFFSFLLAPPFMGFIAEYASLSLAFALIVPFTALTFLWIWLANRA